MTLDAGPISSRKKKIFAAAGALLVVAALGGAVAAWWMLRPGPFGMETRVAWTTSKIIGSPEPADPFITERIFPGIKFNKPVDIAFVPGSRQIVVVEQDGKILSFLNDDSAATTDLLLDLTQCAGLKKIPGYHGIEAYSVTFDPNFKDNHFCYVCYRIVFPKKHTALDYAKQYPQNKTAARVSRFVIAPGDPATIDPKTETILITWPGGGHNGGCIKFGPDSNLYISTGDNGDSNPPDPFNVGQDLGDLRGKILRIDVQNPSSEHPYSIPADNPFSSMRDARPEVFAYGLENPWRFSFDRGTGEPWIADVGWELYETVHHLVGGANYGWSITDGPALVHPGARPGPSAIIPPLLALPHAEAGAIIGGFVYRGTKLAALTGQYIFGDFETRRLWAAPLNGFKLGKYHRIAQTAQRIIAFGEDQGGELCILDHEGGGLYRIAPNPNAGAVDKFPVKLSETGLFADVAHQQPSAGVVPFDVVAPQWLDNATSEHFAAVPGSNPIIDSEEGTRVYPKNTVLVRTLSLPMITGDATSRRKIETQVLHYDGLFWHGYSYKWDDSQSDAMLIDEKGIDLPLSIVDPAAPGGKRPQTWHFNSRAQCMTCHTKWSGYALAFNELQLDRTEQYHTATHGVVSDNQVRSFQHIGLLPTPRPPETKDGAPPPRPLPQVVLANPYEDDPRHTLEDRARSYLHVNCSVCHRAGGGGNAIIDLDKSKDLRDTRLISEPVLGAFDLPDSQIVCPGDPSRSVLYFRMARTGAGHMASLGPSMIDDPGLELIAKWIVSLRGTPGGARIAPDLMQELGSQRNALQTLQNGAVGDTATNAMEKLLSSPNGALKLLTALQDGRIASNLRPTIVQRAMNASQDSVRDLFSRFLADRESYLSKLGNNPDIDKLLAMPGNIERGQKIFFVFNGGLCGKCHIIGDQGIESGPNLNLIGAKYSKADILDNILHPSKSIVPGYETYVVRTKSEPSKPGDTYVGFLVHKSDAEVVLKDQQHKLVRIPADNVEKMMIEPTSAMPEGLLSNLDMQQVADLLEYLATRK